MNVPLSVTHSQCDARPSVTFPTAKRIYLFYRYKIYRVTPKNMPLPNYQKIVLNRIVARHWD